MINKLLIPVFFTVVYLFCFIFAENESISSFSYNAFVFLGWINLISLYLICKGYNDRNITPLSYFFISVFIFILSRPLLGIFLPEEAIIEAGWAGDNNSILLAFSFVMLMVNAIAFNYLSFQSLSVVIFNSVSFKLSSSKSISRIAFYLSFVLGFLFLYYSFSNYKSLSSGMDYFTFAEALDTSYFRFFFIAKYLLFLYLIFSDNKNSFLIAAFLCFLFSIGFIIIGLRGYTIAYFFLFLMALDLYKRLNLIVLASISVALLFVSSIVLNFRLGYDVTSNLSDMILKPIFQQGASFEVVFGSVNFPKEINECIGYVQYFSGGDFGHCVDISRGVFFEQGGFASSFFAEAFYFYPVILFIVMFFGFFLAFVNTAYKAIGENKLNNKSYLILFFIIPNLVYFSRSSAFDFVSKAFEIIIFMFVVNAIYKFLVKSNSYE
ncbi:TPA: O-antigen polysaccharide polymerase Wzy [Photobacterium damselae]